MATGNTHPPADRPPAAQAQPPGDGRPPAVTTPPAARGIRTAAVHAGEAPDPVTGASAPNVVMSTTFVQEDTSGFSAHDLDEASGFVYTRWANPTVAQLEAKLAALEGGEDCVCFASGMAASTGLLLTLLGSGDHVVMTDTNYAGVAELARDTLPRLGIGVSLVDTSNPANVASALRPNTKLVWLETPANPIVRLTDIRAVAEIAAGHANVRVAVDSTFATPVATRPLDLGADYVVHSLTKYICGHGDAVGGAVIGSRDDMTALRSDAGVHHGGVLSPFNAWLINRGAATLPARMRAHEENALTVARFLEEHPGVTRVFYPGLPSHPQHGLAKRQMANFSGMLTFHTANQQEVAERMVKDLRVFHYAVSLGHHRSLVFWMETEGLMETSFRLTGDQLASFRSYASDGIFRVSVGLEDPDDLCADLERVLDCATL